MSWREFCDISKACFISEEKKRKVVFDLLNFGSLIQFGIQNQHFYSPQFIADLLERFFIFINLIHNIFLLFINMN